MKLRPVLGEVDYVCLKDIIKFPELNRFHRASEIELLSDLLATVHVTKDIRFLDDRVGLYDVVRMVSPVDSRDWFKLSIVPPEDEDFTLDRFSALEPISLAVLGRRCGEWVNWDAPVGRRKMSIVSVTKLADCLA